MKIGDQIAETLQVHRGYSNAEARKRAIELLGLTRIPEAAQRADQYPFEFSGGMLQRAMIATAIACEPSVLIADEPTTALDVTIQAQILDLLNDLQRDTNMAIILITHDLGVVARMADTVCRDVRRRDGRARQRPRHLLPRSPPLHTGFAGRDAKQCGCDRTIAAAH